VNSIQTAQEDEITLVEQARGGDQAAFRLLVDRHARALFRLAFRMTGNELDAEDVVQETFLKVWRQLGKFDGRATFGTWLHRICANCALDHLRARKHRQGVPFEDTEPVAADAPSPERMALSAQVQAILMPALDELTGMERAAFIMRHYEGLGIEQISAALGVQRGAAKHSVFRAVQKLRRALEPVAVMSGKSVQGKSM
jgi:RNA polymerase sigma-70 factor (ECF subfamily)